MSNSISYSDAGVSIDNANIASFSLTNVTLSPAALVGYLEFTSGTATLTRVYVCPANCYTVDGAGRVQLQLEDCIECGTSK